MHYAMQGSDGGDGAAWTRSPVQTDVVQPRGLGLEDFGAFVIGDHWAF